MFASSREALERAQTQTCCDFVTLNASSAHRNVNEQKATKKFVWLNIHKCLINPSTRQIDYNERFLRIYYSCGSMNDFVGKLWKKRRSEFFTLVTGRKMKSIFSIFKQEIHRKKVLLSIFQCTFLWYFLHLSLRCAWIFTSQGLLSTNERKKIYKDHCQHHPVIPV
jgi:hypothetical protein